MSLYFLRILYKYLAIHVGYDILTAVVMKTSIFWESLLLAWLILQTLKIEATFSFETAVDFQPAKRRYIPGDKTLNLFIKIVMATKY
jgi:hypothetical protein